MTKLREKVFLSMEDLNTLEQSVLVDSIITVMNEREAQGWQYVAQFSNNDNYGALTSVYLIFERDELTQPLRTPHRSNRMIGSEGDRAMFTGVEGVECPPG